MRLLSRLASSAAWPFVMVASWFLVLWLGLFFLVMDRLVVQMQVLYRCATCGGEVSASEASESECGGCRAFRKAGV